jgi:ABC-2 type transport system ATP-binding protein
MRRERMGQILEIEHLSKHYPGFSLRDVNISLESGYIMGFIGPNGAGKTTTIKLIMNLIRRDAGAIRVFGLDNLRDEVQVRERIGFVYEENYYYEDMTINELRRIIKPFYQQWDDQVFHSYLERFELPAKKKIKDLSRGMKMKLSLAVALSHHADLIIMDEPTSGLDPVFRSELLEILTGIIQDENKGIFFSTHITTDLDKVADYITFIHQGKVVLSDAKDSILEQYALVKGGNDLLDNDLRQEFIGLRENRFGFEGLVRDAVGARRLFEGKAIFEQPSLEEIMLFTVKGDHRA